MTDVCPVRGDLRPHPSMARIAADEPSTVDGVSIGEWTLARAAFTDRHQHAEVNVVVAGELHVTCAGATHVLGPGDRIVVPGGQLARYSAPEYAHMVYVYGPGIPGIADTHYEEF
ncbi:MAG: cupin domain-containing protein [Sporichthyaceae bacterium]